MSPSTESQTLEFVAFQTAPASEQMEKDFLTLAASLAAHSNHPSSAAITRIAKLNQCPQCPVMGFQDFPGRGFGGAVQLPGERSHRAVLIGVRSFLDECGLEIPAILEVAVRQWEKEGAEVLFGGWDGYVRGLLKFSKKA
jgi:cation transport ATPase